MLRRERIDGCRDPSLWAIDQVVVVIGGVWHMSTEYLHIIHVNLI